MRLRTQAIRPLAVSLAVLMLAGCWTPSDTELVEDAKIALQKEDFNSALIRLKSALQRNPNLPEARYLLGSTLLRGGDAVGAAVELQKAKDLGHPADLVVPRLAEAMLVTRQAKKVLEQYADTKLGDPKAGSALQAVLAGAYQVAGDPAKASAAIDAALDLDGTNIVAQLLAARRSAGAADIDGALKRVDDILRTAPKRLDALVFKGDLLWHGKAQPDAAAAAYRQALAADGAYVPAHAALLRLLLERADLPAFRTQVASLVTAAPTHPTTHFFAAQLGLLDRDFARARTSVAALLQSASGDPTALQLAGMIEYQGGSPKAAEAHLVKVLQIAPGAHGARRMLAETYLRTGQPAKALQVLQPALAAAEPEAATLALAARAHLQAGDLVQAERLFTAAGKADPNDTKSRTAIALTRISRGELDAGFSLLESLAAADKTAYADLALISARLQRNDFAAALVAIDRFIAKSGDKPLPHLLRGRTMLARGDLAQARVSFDKALAADAASFPAVQGLAAVDLAQGQPQAARARYEAFVKGDPRNHLALLALAQLRMEAGERPELIESLLVDAVKLNPGEQAPRLALIDHRLQRHQVKAAVDAAQEAVAAMPDDVQLQDALGRAHLAAGDQRQALNAFNKIAAQRPGDPLAQVRLAEAYRAGNDLASASQSLRRALTIKPDLVAAQRGLVTIAVLEKRIDEALQVARTVQKQRPREAVGFQMEGEVLLGQQKLEPAQLAFKAALDREPTTNNATRLHALYASAGRDALADRLAESWLREHPRDAAFLFYLASGDLSRGNLKSAEAQYRKVLALEPTNASSMNNLAWLLVRQGKPGAVQMAEQAVQLMPGNAGFMDTLAMALAAEKQWPKAIEWQRKSLEREPQSPLLRLHLARHLIGGGDKEAARAELQKLVALGGGFDKQAEVSALLKSL